MITNENLFLLKLGIGRGDGFIIASTTASWTFIGVAPAPIMEIMVAHHSLSTRRHLMTFSPEVTSQDLKYNNNLCIIQRVEWTSSH